MTMTEWAENEVKLVCKDFNSYGGAPFDAALKAYKALMRCGLTGFQYPYARDILEKLINEIPLSPITDEDFVNADGFDGSNGVKTAQCRRKYSLFRDETKDGKLSYHDVRRQFCVNVENPSDSFSSGISNFIDELFPITMPYMPIKGQYKVYVKTWLTDESHGDYDVHEVIGFEDPNGKWFDYHLFEYYGDDNVEIVTSEERMEELRSKRIDSLEDNVLKHLSFVITDLYSEEISKREDYIKIESICNDVIKKYHQSLSIYIPLLMKTNERGICYLNTFSNHRTIVKGNEQERDDLIEKEPSIKELIEIVETIKKEIRETLKTE